MSLQTSSSTEFTPSAVSLVAAAKLEGDSLTIAIDGELDMATIHVLEEAHLSVRGSYRALRYELAGLGFIDSAGLRALLAPASGQLPISEISLSHPTRAVRRMLELRDLQGMITGCVPLD